MLEVYFTSSRPPGFINYPRRSTNNPAYWNAFSAQPFDQPQPRSNQPPLLQNLPVRGHLRGVVPFARRKVNVRSCSWRKSNPVVISHFVALDCCLELVFFGERGELFVLGCRSPGGDDLPLVWPRLPEERSKRILTYFDLIPGYPGAQERNLNFIWFT